MVGDDGCYLMMASDGKLNNGGQWWSIIDRNQKSGTWIMSAYISACGTWKSSKRMNITAETPPKRICYEKDYVWYAGKTISTQGSVKAYIKKHMFTYTQQTLKHCHVRGFPFWRQNTSHLRSAMWITCIPAYGPRATPCLVESSLLENLPNAGLATCNQVDIFEGEAPTTSLVNMTRVERWNESHQLFFRRWDELGSKAVFMCLRAGAHPGTGTAVSMQAHLGTHV